MALLLDDLQDSVPRSWLLEHITIFADDIHVYCLFRDVSERLERLNVSKRLLKTWDSNSAHPNRA